MVCLLMPGKPEVIRVSTFIQIMYFDFGEVVMYVSLSLSHTTTGIGHVSTDF